MRPNAGEHEGRIGPEAGGFYPDLAPVTVKTPPMMAQICVKKVERDWRTSRTCTCMGEMQSAKGWAGVRVGVRVKG